MFDLKKKNFIAMKQSTLLKSYKKMYTNLQ